MSFRLSPMAITHEGSAPYAPVSHVLRAIELYREKAPAAFSKDLLMRLGYQDAYALRTMKALRLLDLIDDDGAPTDAFKELRRATTEEYVPRLEQVVRTAYAEVFEVVDPAADPNTSVHDAFRFYNPAAQRDKMVILFMGLCEAAGIIGADRAPRKRLRGAAVAGTARRRERSAEVPGGSENLKPPAVKNPPEGPPAKTPASATSAEALRVRYLDMLMKKVETQDELDEGLLDRIEALLGYGTRSGKDEPKD